MFLEKRRVRICLSLVALLVVVELGMRVSGHLFHRWHYRGIEQKETVALQDHVRILAIGESTTEGIWLDSVLESYPFQLERKLNQQYSGKKFKVIVPEYIGMNTSQMHNRMGSYLKAYKPHLVLFMCGINNEWSLSESTIRDYIEDPFDGLTVRVSWWLDKFRIYKLGRYIASRFNESIVVQPFEFLGVAAWDPFPASSALLRFGGKHGKAFVRLWRTEVSSMIKMSKANSAKVILMTYPNYGDGYLSVREFEKMSVQEDVPLVRNDLLFKEIFQRGEEAEYFFSDLRHPNKKGYELVANAVLAAITHSPALPRANSRR